MRGKLKLRRKTVKGFYVITSPDLPGLCVTGKNKAEAMAELFPSIDAYLAMQGQEWEIDPADIVWENT
jgi:predicted RNase H-like HicB family nuclease